MGGRDQILGKQESFLIFPNGKFYRSFGGFLFVCSGFQCLHIYGRQSIKEKSLCWFSFQMLAIASAGPGQSQKPGSPSGSPTWQTETQAFAKFHCLPGCIIRKLCQKQSSRNTSWHSVWDAGVPSCGLIQYTLMPGLRRKLNSRTIKNSHIFLLKTDLVIYLKDKESPEMSTTDRTRPDQSQKPGSSSKCLMQLTRINQLGHHPLPSRCIIRKVVWNCGIARIPARYCHVGSTSQMVVCHNAHSKRKISRFYLFTIRFSIFYG